MRRRVRLLKDPYPHFRPSIRLLDNIVLIVGIIGPMMALPQIWRIYIEHNAAGVSAFTWGMFAFFNIFWITYAIVHKTKILLIPYCLWFVMNSTVAIGALMYS